MPRRFGFPLFGLRFCGNIDTNEVHDLESELDCCHIDEIITTGHARAFYAIEDAEKAGFQLGQCCRNAGRI